MNPQQINVAIAEVQGWKWFRIGTETKPYRCLCIPHPAYTPADMTEPVCNYEYMAQAGKLPNYYASLDACAEMEAGLTEEEGHKYAHKLLLIFERASNQGSSAWTYLRATAPQKCEAFCRVKGLWVEHAGEGK